jgi:hypothetical protein
MADFFDPRRVSGSYDKDKTPGIKLDSGPFVGIVKNNTDAARLGRLKVYIPDIGGDEKASTSWFTVTYASPFYGQTTGTDSAADSNFGTEQQTYGFWAVPPDLDNQVLCTFVAGDPSRGFWFACIPTSQSKHMIPGIARGRDFPDGARGQYVYPPELDPVNRELTKRNVYLPNSELNLNSTEKDTRPDYLAFPKVVHSFQAETVIQQGLETDPVRGTITSSSQRETPSAVFGISTPGRTVNDLKDKFKTKQAIDEELNKPESTITSNQRTARKGGHTLVMDDGDVYGDSNLVRLRTAGGHTILMHDTENIIYITNKDGTAYVELTPNGAVNVYSAKTLSVRSELDINLHADANVNIQAGDSINFHAEKNIETHSRNKSERITNLHHVDSGRYDLLVGGPMKVKSGATSGWHVGSGELWMTGSQIHLNTGGKTIATPDHVAPLEQYRKQDVKYDTKINRWVINPASTLDSIATFTPTHEPWSRETGRLVQNSGTIKPSTKQQDI